MSDWRGFTPEQMTEKLRDRARAKTLGGTYTSAIPTTHLLIEAADLIEWLAKRVEEAQRPRCEVCGAFAPWHLVYCPSTMT